MRVRGTRPRMAPLSDALLDAKLARLKKQQEEQEQRKKARRLRALEKRRELAKLKRAGAKIVRVKVPSKAVVGGIPTRQIKMLQKEADRYLSTPEGMAELESKIKHTTLVILLIDGLIGTELWRNRDTGRNAGYVASQARLRYLDNASRILGDLKSAGHQVPVLEGVDFGHREPVELEEMDEDVDAPEPAEE